ncbi:Type 1 glutamine amidotransferase-like domain-containing protein [Priestia taiwanensis]|uniref:Peptidase E n=1 Tax=Priestia taiwanensis TaxID=1347902 RepID=A0A917EM89_9BACI|nr:Type 1 glutamine amidotransferase-like domain-containing protein [Priestia taiwanensis]MBM7361683.1 dipeptidase E [Priestia taiwanensis]GGE56166.1 hypothetical protein GCM10007140_03080 [Priestia taiwanensis]
MGKMFFYSDQVVVSPRNRRLDVLLLDGREVEKVRVGYIPSTEDKEREYFKKKVQYYERYGIQDIFFFDLYSEFNPLKIEELLTCDIIHLSAGDPIICREALKERGMEEVLRRYVQQGGTVVGVSGGAVQFGKSANLYSLFIGECNDEEFDTLHLVDFEFLPHYNRWNDDFKREVFLYAKMTGVTIYAGNDGDGLIVDEDGTVHMIGDIVVINGE